MKKTFKIFILTFLSTMFAVTMLASPASAITNGAPDGDNHPYVCLVVFDWDHDSNPLTPAVPGWRTTGILISPTVVLTAGHGTDGAVAARVWFAPGPIPTVAQGGHYPNPGPDAIEATPYTNPEYRSLPLKNGLPYFDYHDVGVVILDREVTDKGYGQLPTAGYVDSLAPMTSVDLVGYGVEYQVNPRNMGPRNAWYSTRTRLYAPATYVGSSDIISSEFMKLTANPGQGKGGTTFGDSGGPIFEAGTNKILAVNSFVTNVNCAGVTYAQRIDILGILNWIGSF